MNGAIESVLWPGLHKLHPASKLGGIIARKPGYHNSRDHLTSRDYSVGQFVVDRVGPANLGSAIDWTFPDAQGGDYKSIKKYSKRLMDAGRANDPRTVYMREFYGNADDDREVEGWDFTKDRAASSDSSHLWHIHISIHRKYINDKTAMEAILSILSGEDLSDWLKATGGKLTVVAGRKPAVTQQPFELEEGDKGPLVQRIQERFNVIFPAYKATPLKVDGIFGKNTKAAIVEFQQRTNLKADGIVGPQTRAMLARYGIKL